MLRMGMSIMITVALVSPFVPYLAAFLIVPVYLLIDVLLEKKLGE